MAGNNPRPPSPFHERGSYAAVLPKESTQSGAAESGPDVWDSTRHEVERLASRASDMAGNAWQDVAGLVRRYPLAAVGLGIALGCLLACALPRGDDMTRKMARSSA